jgi:hypothetical protein
MQKKNKNKIMIYLKKLYAILLSIKNAKIF